MDSICAYFDTQGFYHKGIFYPVEVAVSSRHIITSISVAHGLDLTTFSKKDKKNVTFGEQYHGIPFHSKEDRMDGKLLPVFLRHFFHDKIIDDKSLVACKSLEAERILKTLGIPCINLAEEGGTWKNIFTGRKPCNLHLNGDKCSLNAVLDLKHWVNSL